MTGRIRAGADAGRVHHHGVNRASDRYGRDGKTGARDAAVIADQARIRGDLLALRTDHELTVEPKPPTTRRSDLVHDRTPTTNWPRAAPTGSFPALERPLDPAGTGPPVLPAGHRTPARLRQIGRAGPEAWLRAVRGAPRLAQAAVDAADRRHTGLILNVL